MPYEKKDVTSKIGNFTKFSLRTMQDKRPNEVKQEKKAVMRE